jgi:chemotaxis protein MotA
VDPLLIAGFVAAIVGIVVATLIDGNSFGVLIGPSSLVLVLLGSIGATLMAQRMPDLKSGVRALACAFKGRAPDLDGTVTTLGQLADVARREGMLALETRLKDVEDPALRTGLQLMVDGLDADQLRDILSIDIAAVDERHQRNIGFFKSLGSYAPTFGMLGTVIGLVNMLQNLSDPSQLGIGMALALLTTLYGVAFANLVFLPIAARLTRLNEAELAARDLILDGILSIQSGMSPRLLVERLETYLPPEARVGHGARTGTVPKVAPVQEAA